MGFTPYGLFRTRLGELIKQTPIGYIQTLLDLPGDALVRLYSYQSNAAFAAAQARGYWTGGHDRFGADQDCEDFSPWDFDGAYDWMREQMTAHIPQYSGEYPIWGWVKRPSTKPKPGKYMGTKGEVRLTVLVPRSRILFSDYELYHAVLNQSYLSSTEDDSDEFRTKFGPITDENHALLPAYLDAIRPSWQKCLTFHASDDPAVLSWGGSRKYFRIQACIDRLYWKDIVAVRHF